MNGRGLLFSFLRRRKSDPPPQAPEPTPVSRFVCRTCNTKGPFYVARQVTNWTTISEPWRTPSGDLTYRTRNSYLPGTPGPALAYYCGHCQTSYDTLEELVIEPAFLEAITE